MENQSGAECVLVRGGASYEGKQALTYFSGISAESAGSKGLCLHLLTIPPGARARPHLHESHESAIYVLSGQAKMRYGERLTQVMTTVAGDFVYIPAGVPHQPFNDSDAPCTALIARTDPNEQESVVLLDEGGRRRANSEPREESSGQA